MQVLWIDHDHVKIFDFSSEGENVKHFNNTHHMDHHTNHYEQEKIEQQKKFYKDVSSHLANTVKFLIVGPDMAKLDFKKYLEEHSEHLLAKNIIGVETLPKMSDGQIRDFAKGYFHKYNLFH